MRHYASYILTLLCIAVSLSASAFNVRRVTGDKGLSNSSVTSIMQDNRRFLWIGTYDGLNMYDGRTMRSFKPDMNDEITLSSNVIYDIVKADDEYIWLSTKWGLDRFSTYSNKVRERFVEFNGDCSIAVDSRGNLLCLGYRGFLSVYDPDKKAFTHLPIDHNAESSRQLRNLAIDSDDIIYIICDGEIRRYRLVESPGSETRFKIIALPKIDCQSKISQLFSSDRKIIFTDTEGDLYKIDNSRIVRIANIKRLTDMYGAVTSILADDDIFLAFKTYGLIKLNRSRKYRPETLYDKGGVFSLYRDRECDMIWFGTDGDGIYALTQDEHTFHNIPFEKLTKDKQRPIKAIRTDPKGSLWISSKENGIIRMLDYRSDNYSAANVKKYTTSQGGAEQQ